jgi:hypothetical protein
MAPVTALPIRRRPIPAKIETSIHFEIDSNGEVHILPLVISPDQIWELVGALQELLSYAIEIAARRVVK